MDNQVYRAKINSILNTDLNVSLGKSAMEKCLPREKKEALLLATATTKNHFWALILVVVYSQQKYKGQKS